METTAIKISNGGENNLTSLLILKNNQRINYFESDGIYSFAVLDDGSRIKTDMYLHHIEKTLSRRDYVRCGWSFIVNINKIQEFWILDNPFLVMENGEVIPVPQTEKDILKEIVADRGVIKKEL